jgi:hypothetical protein
MEVKVMQIKLKVIIFSLMIVLLNLITSVCGGEKMMNQNLQNYVQNRRIVIEQLLSIAKKNIKSSSKESEEMREIITMLGKLRAEEAAEFLVQYIALMPSGTFFEKTIANIYPAVGALIQIGYPSVLTILNTGFLRERSDLEQKLMAHVICSVLGDGYRNPLKVGRRLGRLIIQEHLRSANPPKQVRERLIKFMENYFPAEKPIKRH